MKRPSKYLNELSESEAKLALEKCCASQEWIDRMNAERPFADDDKLQETAAEIWNSLSSDAWMQAFAAHPRIGDVSSLRAKFASTKGWAEGEQSGAAKASEETISQLAAGNEEYFQKFGYIFIVCATGKTADEMLELLQSRLPNDPQIEIKVAAAEQMKITILRLNKLANDCE